MIECTGILRIHMLHQHIGKSGPHGQVRQQGLECCQPTGRCTDSNNGNRFSDGFSGFARHGRNIITSGPGYIASDPAMGQMMWPRLLMAFGSLDMCFSVSVLRGRLVMMLHRRHAACHPRGWTVRRRSAMRDLTTHFAGKRKSDDRCFCSS